MGRGLLVNTNVRDIRARNLEGKKILQGIYANEEPFHKV